MWKWFFALVLFGFVSSQYISCSKNTVIAEGSQEVVEDAGQRKDSIGTNTEPVVDGLANPDRATPLPDRVAPAPDQVRPSPDETTEKPDWRDPPAPDFDKTSLLVPKSKTNHSFTGLHFSGSQNCARCHNGLRDEKGKDVSIVTAWSSTMMANSTRDPLWQAKMKSELSRQPQLKDLINEKCTRCHAPMASHESKVQKKTIHTDAGGLLDPKNPLFDHTMAGVSCTSCHQIQDTPKLGTLAGVSGKYTMPVYTSTANRMIFGPYTNPFPNPMQMDVSYTPTYSKHITSSKLCASCHDLKTPFVDKDGKVVPKTPEQEFPEQMVYSEWKHSGYSKGTTAKSCQSCHMQRSNGVKISTRPPWLSARNNFGQHIFVGANVFMLNMLNKNRELLGISANNFAFTIQKTRELLQSSAKLSWLETTFVAGSLLLRLKVQNQSGHKLPSGYPSRRVYIHLVVKNSQGTIVFESGKAGANGKIVGLDADENPTRYEPHHKEITRPEQVQVYEAVMKTPEGGVTYTLLRAATYQKDNRLLPLGFQKETAPKDVAVLGAASQDSDFNNGSDTITYRIPNLPVGRYQVEAKLNYQTVGYRFAQDLFRDNKLKEVLLFQYLWLQATSYFETITSLSTTVSP